MADIQSNIKFNIDTTDAMASIKALQAQISAFQTQMSRGSSAQAAEARNLQRTLIDNVNATGKFDASLTTIKTTTESFTTSLEKNKLSMREYFRYSGGASKSFGRFFKQEFETIGKVARERVKDLQTQYIQLGRDANGAMQAIKVRPLLLDLDSMATKTAIAAQKQAMLNQLLKQGSTNLLNFGKNTQWAGRQLMVGFTIPLGIMGTAAAKSFMEMEAATIKFQRVYGDLSTTVQESDAMIGTIKQLASEFTKYGVSFKDTMTLAADAAAMGKTGAALTQQVTETNRLAVLGNVEQAAALETTTSLMDAFAISAENLGEKINFLNAVENQTVTSIEDLTIAIPKAGPVIKQLGGDVEDLAFFLTAMREGGINASEGANALKSGLASLINPTQKASDFMARFGININQLVESNKGDVKGLVLDFADALKTLDPLNRARAIEQLFGKFQFARMSTLFQNVIAEGSQASKVLELTNATATELGMLAGRELGKLAESPMYKFQKAVADIQAQLAPVGEEFLKAVTPIIEFGTKILEWFNGLEAGTKQFIVNLVGIVGGIGPIFLMTFGLIANGAANIIKLFALMKNGFNKLGGGSRDLATQTQYMTNEQVEAAAVAASLDQAHNKLRQTFTLEAGALDRLTAAYQRNATASGMRPVIPGKKFASGGMIMGSGTGTSDSIPAMVSNGEYIVNAKATKQNLPLLQAINNGGIAKFAEGGLASSTKKSLYGGAQRMLAPLTMQLPGNVAGGFGMSPEALGSQGFIESLRNTFANFALMEDGTRRTTKALQEMAPMATDAANQVTEALRTTAQEMKDSGKAATHISEIFDNARPKLEKIMNNLNAQGGKSANMAKALQLTAFPTDEDILSSGYGRTPAVRMKETGEVHKSTWFKNLKGRAKSFFSGIKPTERALGTPNFSDVGISGVSTAAHITPEGRSLRGPDIPYAGGVMGESEAVKAKAVAELERKSKAYVDSLVNAMTSGFDKATKRNSPPQEAIDAGEDYGKALNSGAESQIDEAKTAGQKLSSAVVAGATQSGGRRRRASSGTSVMLEGVGYVDSSLVSPTMLGPAAPTAAQRKQMKTDTRKYKFKQAKQNAINYAQSGKLGGKISGGSFAASGVSAVASMAAPPEMQGTLAAISTALSFVGMFGNTIAKIVPILIRFAGPIGIIVTAVTAVVGVFNLLTEETRKRAEQEKNLANATKITTKQMQSLGTFFGKTITPKDFVGGRFSGSPEADSAVSQLRADSGFKEDYKDVISTLKSSSMRDAQLVLSNLALKLSSDFAPEEIQVIVEALKQEAKKTSVLLDVKEIVLSKENGIKGLEQVLGIAEKKIAGILSAEDTRLMGIGLKLSEVLTEEDLSRISTYANVTSNGLEALRNSFNSGVISLKQYRAGMSRIQKSFDSMNPRIAKKALKEVMALLQFDPKESGAINSLDNIRLRLAAIQAMAVDAAKAMELVFKINNASTTGEIEAAKLQLLKLADTKVKLPDITGGGDYVDPNDGGGSGKGTGPTKEDKLRARLQLIEIQEERINKKYEDRKKALEEIKKVQEQISAQQRDQLDLADALTRGDIAAAAKAAQQMRANNATRAIEQQQVAMDAAQQKEIGALRDPQFGRSKQFLQDALQQLDIQELYKTLGMKAPAFGTPTVKVPAKTSAQTAGTKASTVNNKTINNSPVYNITVTTSSSASPGEIANIVTSRIKSIESQKIKGSRLE